MTQLEVTGRRDRLDAALAALQHARLAEVAPAPPGVTGPSAGDAPSGEAQGDPIESQRLAGLEAELLRLLALAPPAASATENGHGPGSALRNGSSRDPDDVTSLVAGTKQESGPPETAWRELVEELETLPRIEASLSALITLVPELSSLNDAELAAVHLATVVLMLDDPDGAVVAELRVQLHELLGERALLVAAPTGSATGCLLVVPSAQVRAVENLLGRDHVERMSLPPGFGGHSLQSTVAAMRARIADLPELITASRSRLDEALAPHRAELAAALDAVRALQERRAAADHSWSTERAFALRLWVPRHAVAAVRDAVASAEPAVVVEPVPAAQRSGQPPVLVRNPRLLRPFERLVGFLSWPAPGGLDPTGLMAAVLPALFGIMVGDVGYGVLLIGLGIVARRRWGPTSPAVSDIGRILTLGGGWAVGFGLLFGELFGDLGKKVFGMPALWFYRGGQDALTPLLGFVIAVGAAHLVLGLLIGVWLAVRERDLPHLLERAGTLLVIGGLFAVAGAAVSALPGSVLPPALAVVVVGVVLAGVTHGWLGILLGPLEVIGRIGNILSYLRLAAVGLASVYLAVVANELARQAPLLLGIVVAAFFHALNLALAAFSPMIQALRLHYVEFFSTFHTGGGRAFHPLGADLAIAPRSAPDP